MENFPVLCTGRSTFQLAAAAPTASKYPSPGHVRDPLLDLQTHETSKLEFSNYSNMDNSVLKVNIFLLHTPTRKLYRMITLTVKMRLQVNSGSFQASFTVPLQLAPAHLVAYSQANTNNIFFHSELEWGTDPSCVELMNIPHHHKSWE